MNRFNVYGFHIFKFHFNLNSFIMVFTNHFSFIYYNSQANINTLIKTADYMMRSKSISRGTEKTASLVICFCVSVNDAVFNYIISINKVMNSFLINVILLKFFLIYTLKNILLNNNKLFKLLIKEDIFISIYFSI